MSTTYTFTPNISNLYTFQPTLDGIVYSASVPWNIFGQRFYLLITDGSGNLVLNVPLTSSSENATYSPINLIAGYFLTSTLYYYQADGIIVVGP